MADASGGTTLIGAEGATAARPQNEMVAAMASSNTMARPKRPKEKLTGVRQSRTMIVSQLWRFPVKSLGGERLPSLTVGERGALYDRGFALVAAGEQLRDVLFTARRAERLLSFIASANAAGEVTVRSPAGAEYQIGDAQLLDELAKIAGTPLLLTKANGTPFFDAMDLHVVTSASVRRLEQEWGQPLDPRRFRANIVLEGDAEPFDEEGWVGKRFSVGGVVIDAVELCPRCAMPTIDPSSYERSPDLLKLLTDKHATNFGVYCRVVQPGRIALGDDWLPCR